MRLIPPLLAALTAAGCASGPAPCWMAAADVEPVLQEEQTDCGAAALASLLAYWEVSTSLAELREACDLGPEGIAAGTLRDVARRAGLEAYLIRAEREDLERELAERRPVLVGVVRSGRAHYALVTGLAAERVLLVDPAAGRVEQGWSRFAREWAGAANLALVAFPR